MIDFAKRKSLKTIITASGTAAALAASGSAASTVLTHLTGNGNSEETLPSLATIRVTTRVSPSHNDLEVVLQNTSSDSVTITHMTPAITKVPRGQFDFTALLSKGPLHLAPGEVVAVPLQHHAVSLAGLQHQSGHSLTETLQKSMSIITDGNSFASVSISDAISVA